MLSLVKLNQAIEKLSLLVPPYHKLFNHLAMLFETDHLHYLKLEFTSPVEAREAAVFFEQIRGSKTLTNLAIEGCVG